MEIHKKNEKEFVFLDNKKEQKIEITEINLDYIKNNESSFDPYRIGIGDGLSITVWGLPEVFPMVNLNKINRSEELILMAQFSSHMLAL